MIKNDKKAAVLVVLFLFIFQTVSYSALDMGMTMDTAPVTETQAPGVDPAESTSTTTAPPSEAPGASTDFLMDNPMDVADPVPMPVQEEPPVTTTRETATPEVTTIPTTQDPIDLSDSFLNSTSFDVEGADDSDEVEAGTYIDLYGMADLGMDMMDMPPPEEGGAPDANMLGGVTMAENAMEIENEEVEVFAVNDDEEIQAMKTEITNMAKGVYETQVALEKLIEDVEKGRIYPDVARSFILQLQYENQQLMNQNKGADKDTVAANNKKIATNNSIIADFMMVIASDGKARGKIVASLKAQLANIDKLRREILYYLDDSKLNTAAKRAHVQGLLDGRWKTNSERFKNYKEYADKLIKGFVKPKRG